MKVKYLIISFIAAIFLPSAISENRNLTIGSKAPEIQTLNGNSLINNNENKNTVVNFWSPKNPASRILNKKLSENYQKDNSNTVFLSICIEDESFMKEILKVDSIHNGTHYASSQINPRVLKDYNIEKGLGAYMISPEGKILSLNP